MLRIHFTYRHVDKPWGGANNFIRALRAYLATTGRFQLVDSPGESWDVLFMNQLAAGPADESRPLSLSEVRGLLQRYPGRRLVVRAVNLNRHAFGLGPRNLLTGWWRDRQTVALLNLAHVVIFQSEYQKSFFARAGWTGANGVVIHNGAAPVFAEVMPAAEPSTELRLVSSSASARATKRHDLLAALSRQSPVRMVHFGAWPQGVPQGNVRLAGTGDHRTLASHYANQDYFVHPAERDPCPNSVFEALSAGLPVIYNPAPGSSAEIVGDCGIALREGDLASTLAEARARREELRTRVLSRRKQWSIGTAAGRYAEVFENALSDAHVGALRGTS